MANTITSYVTFTPNTKARATEVNTNFSNHRGDLLPINTDTASASDSTHDLGTSSHRWKDLYAGSADLLGSTSTVNLQIVPNTSSTLGGFAIQAGTSTGKMIEVNSATFSLLLFGNTVASADASGFLGSTIKTDTVDTDQLAPGAVGTDELKNNAVTNTRVADAVLTVTKISPNGDTIAAHASDTIDNVSWAANSSITIETTVNRSVMVGITPTVGVGVNRGSFSATGPFRFKITRDAVDLWISNTIASVHYITQTFFQIDITPPTASTTTYGVSFIGETTTAISLTTANLYLYARSF